MAKHLGTATGTSDGALEHLARHVASWDPRERHTRQGIARATQAIPCLVMLGWHDDACRLLRDPTFLATLIAQRDEAGALQHLRLLGLEHARRALGDLAREICPPRVAAAELAADVAVIADFAQTAGFPRAAVELARWSSDHESARSGSTSLDGLSARARWVRRLHEADEVSQLGPARQEVMHDLNSLANERSTTPSAKLSVGFAYAGLEDHGTAVEHYLPLVRGHEETRDPVAPVVLTSFVALARSLRALGEHARAESALCAALARMRRSGAHPHPLAAAALEMLAGSVHAQGNLSWSLQLHRDLVTLRREQLGEQHYLTHAARTRLALRMAQTCELNEGSKTTEAALTLFDAALGPEHPGTLWVMDAHVTMLLGEGRSREAWLSAQRAARHAASAFGERHRTTLLLRMRVAEALRACDDTEKAEGELQEILASCHGRSSQADDPLTQRVEEQLRQAQRESIHRCG